MEKQTIFSEMWSAYRGVIMHSIVTSFGLDFLVKDQAGGDVDTIHNVRESGIYKNAHNAAAYENRGEYDSVAYHQYREDKGPYGADAGDPIAADKKAISSPLDAPC